MSFPFMIDTAYNRSRIDLFHNFYFLNKYYLSKFTNYNVALFDHSPT